MLPTAALILAFFLPGPPPQDQAPTWLHPSDAELQFAIDQGYSLKPKVRFDVISLGAGMEPVLRIVPPLSCAEQQGEDAARRLAPKPSVERVQSELCHGLTVIYAAANSRPNSTFAVQLVHGGDAIKPVSSAIDNDGVVPGFLGPHFQVVTSFIFDLPAAWKDKVEIRYSDGYNLKTKTVNLDAFARDEASHRTK